MIDPRLREYETRHHCRLPALLGPGTGQDWFVMTTDQLRAVKFFDRRERFKRELEVYQVL